MHLYSFSTWTNRKSLSFLYMAQSNGFFIDTKFWPDPQVLFEALCFLSQKVHPHPNQWAFMETFSSLDNCSYIEKKILCWPDIEILFRFVYLLSFLIQSTQQSTQMFGDLGMMGWNVLGAHVKTRMNSERHPMQNKPEVTKLSLILLDSLFSSHVCQEILFQ